MSFTEDKPIVFAFHGYPSLIHRLTYRRTNHHNLHVRGYKEQGTTTTPFDMAVLNDIDRFHLATDVVARVPSLGPRAAYLTQTIRDKLLDHQRYIRQRTISAAHWRGLTLELGPRSMLLFKGKEGRMSTMTVGRLAKQASVNIDTIWYYERNGLIPEPARRLSGYRQYGSTDVARLRFILRAKDLGLTLAEIGELSSLSADRDVKGVKRCAEVRLEQVEHKIKALPRVRRGLKTLIEACPGLGDLERCPINAALSEEHAR